AQVGREEAIGRDHDVDHLAIGKRCPRRDSANCCRSPGYLIAVRDGRPCARDKANSCPRRKGRGDNDGPERGPPGGNLRVQCATHYPAVDIWLSLWLGISALAKECAPTVSRNWPFQRQAD